MRVLALLALLSVAPALAAEPPYKVGFITALSGHGSVFADAAVQSIRLALEQINAQNLAGRQIELLVVDDATDPRTSADACSRLIHQDRVQAVIGYQSTPARVACEQSVIRARAPYIAASASGGDLCLANLFQIGMAPNQMAGPMIDLLIERGARKFYMLGSDYSSPKASFAFSRRHIEARGGTVVGMSFEPMGTGEFSADIAKIAAAAPDVILESLVGSDVIPFYKQAAADPRVAAMTKASMQLNESTATAIGAAAGGVLAAADYFDAAHTPENLAYIAALKAKYGANARASWSGVLAYDALFLLATAVRDASALDGPSVIQTLKKTQITGPRGAIGFGENGHYATLDVYLAQATREGKFEVVGRAEKIEPQLSCKFTGGR